MEIREHTTKAIDADLQSLNQLVAEMGGYVEKQLGDSIDALVKLDRDRAQRVVSADDAVDELQRKIEELAVTTIATRQPMAVDLREVIGVLRIASELERIGDLAKNVGKRVITLNGDYMPRKAVRGMKHIADLAQRQLRNVLDSFARRDIAAATSVWTRDEEIDAMYTSLFREILTYMMKILGQSPSGFTYCSAPRISNGWAITRPTSRKLCIIWSKGIPSPPSGRRLTPRRA